MRVGNFSLYIPEGRERSSGHVEMAHGTQYHLKLDNHDHRQCDAEVTIDGKCVGTFRIAGHSGINLETVPGDGGRFTFYATDTQEFLAAAGGDVSKDLRGLVQVTFKPEKVVWRHRGPGDHFIKGGGPSLQGQAFNCSNLKARDCAVPTSAGITGMSGHSDQRFHQVPDLVHDQGAEVTISVRLVSGAGLGPRPLVAQRQSNPVPAPVE